MQGKVRLVVYGGRLKGIALGGHLWLSKISKELASYDDLTVEHVEEPSVGSNRLRNIVNAYVKGFMVLVKHPDAILVSAGKDGSAAIGLLHKFISRSSRIYTIVYHYEPVAIGKHSKISYILAKILRDTTFKLNKDLLNQSTAIFTLSNASKKSISEILSIPRGKIFVTGNGRLELPYSPPGLKRDVHFLCVGRFGKFMFLDNIWKEIRRLNKDAVLYMAGIGESDPRVSRLYSIGNFKHKGIVTEETKTSFFKRSKVFIFPSAFEGFGIAVAEALGFGLPVVVWDLLVYREIWCETKAIRRVGFSEYAKFAREAVYALENFEALSAEARNHSSWYP
ncbi:MAG: glycosyltransferase family 4 protein [Candidatus Bathyarchaeia archaeon]|uniref:glycosyltransferase family 4 protein n=1 Tax=Thermofilum sp. TaxID=1961369 RepID=UPI003166714F